ncbi:PD-(D/E)XK nuclease family protein [Lacticaseibacillus jixiensis]|uniref:PD-(D/E)XK nuclease family protein n=1 Tax=Lacticaseibacillus jixiensis TaxID=3231926 RepID=UPI0036F22DE3
MPLQFILGAASADHKLAVTQAIKATLQADAQAEVFYLVPNHLKFEAEVSLLQALRDDSPIVAQSRVQTFSFTRLAWYYLKDTPLYAQPRLDTAANAMLTARLVAEHVQELRLFAGLAHSAGFITKLAAQLSELLAGKIDAQTLAAAADQLPGNDRHRAKLQDLVVMLDAYEEAVGPFATNASLLAALSNHLLEADLSHTYFYLNHFNDLAASEMALVATMMQRGAKLVVCLTMPDETPQQAPSLFIPAQRLHRRLLQSAKQLHVAVQPAVFAPQRAGLSPSMHTVERFFVADTQMAQLDASGMAVDQITLAQADSVYSELRHVAQAINAGVHAGGRYRDYLVIARHLDPYADLIAPVFAQYQIPVFTDREHPMQQHPLVALLESLFAIKRHHYQYNDVMRFLRTGLVVPESMTQDAYQDAVDVCDNHLLRTGITGSYWTNGKPWQYLRRRVQDDTIDRDVDKTAQINAIREFVSACLPPLFAQLDEAATGADAAKALYAWLDGQHVVARLDEWRQAAIDRGDLTDSHAGEQAWQTLIDLLDHFVTILGQAPCDLQQFSDLLEAGFASATYTQIPSTLDQVVVSETALTRLSKFKHVFVIGATSLVMPDVLSDSGLLSAEDREQLQALLPDSAWLAVSGPQSALSDPFINYVGMLAASTSLTMSYPAFGERELHPSPYFTRMQQALHLTPVAWGPTTLCASVKTLAGSPRAFLADLVAVMRQSKDAKLPLSPAWQAVAAQLKQSPLAPLAARLIASVDYTNAVGHLAPSLAQALYGKHLNVSVSRLETFWKNPYEYFLKYGLRLQPRPEFALTPADTGSLYHATLDQVFTKLLDQGQQLADVDRSAIAPLVQEVLAQLAQAPGFEILTTSQQMQYVRRKAALMLNDVLVAIHDQQHRGQFRTKATEVAFGAGRDQHALPALVLPLAGQQSVTVRGKIDRLDTALVDGEEYFLIVDYKSSQRRFKPVEAYYGVALQLLTYIDAAQHGLAQQGETAQAAGALYMQLKRPAVNYAPSLDVAQERFKAFKLYGVLVLPEDLDQAQSVASVFDSSLLTEAGASPVVQIGTTSKGAFAKTSTKTITPEELTLYLAHNRQEITKAAQAILTGEIALAPIQFGQEATTITNSDYQSIMCFDPATGFDRYRRVEALDQAAIIAKLKEEHDA